MAKLDKTKYIFVTGGVLSGVGKGITSASLGKLLKSRGFKVNIQKCDPYLNVDAGTLNPGEHGEVFVTDDGAETDLDVGHYERFLGVNLDKSASLMAGKVFSSVLDAERRGEYLGKTIQIIPHITEEIEKQVLAAGEGYDFHIAELGGTVGDYEGLHFIEAIRRLKYKVGLENVFYIHVVYLPYLATTGEVKTRPAQYSIRELKQLGIEPNMVMLRSDYEVPESAIEKVSLWSDVPKEAIVPLVTAKSVYEVPLFIENAKADDYILNYFKVKSEKNDLKEWRELIEKIKSEKKTVKIGIVAKYLQNLDTYTSIIESLKIAAWENNSDVKIVWIDAEELEKSGTEKLKEVSGILIPGGFGYRGIEGKILAAKYARENNVPYFGICLGLQVAVIEYARNVCGIKDATSSEFEQESQNYVIDIMSSQKNITEKGGTMRLGLYDCKLENDSLAQKIYGKPEIKERHRHRFEFNNAYREEIKDCGLRLSGVNPENDLVEIIENPKNKWFLAVQFHPEFKSKPLDPHPLFVGFIEASLNN